MVEEWERHKIAAATYDTKPKYSRSCNVFLISCAHSFRLVSCNWEPFRMSTHEFTLLFLSLSSVCFNFTSLGSSHCAFRNECIRLVAHEYICHSWACAPFVFMPSIDQLFNFIKTPIQRNGTVLNSPVPSYDFRKFERQFVIRYFATVQQTHTMALFLRHTAGSSVSLHNATHQQCSCGSHTSDVCACDEYYRGSSRHGFCVETWLALRCERVTHKSSNLTGLHIAQPTARPSNSIIITLRVEPP